VTQSDPSAAEALQKIFKILADPTRVRILRLLEQEELIVGELMSILGMAQSRVSRHLAILREAGLLADRRDGTFVAYRLVLPDEGPWHDVWELARRSLASDPTTERDDTMLRRTLAKRKTQAGRNFFDELGGAEWDALRPILGDDLLRARATSLLVPPGLWVADIGTGTGVLAIELAALGLDVIGIDRSEAMLAAARAKRSKDTSSGRLEFQAGDAHALPLTDDSIDAAFAHMVLHSLEEPARAVREMARIVRPGGQIVLVDFLPHEHLWMQHELGLLWLGFEETTVREWIGEAGLELRLVRRQAPDTRRDLPESFIAAARKPDGSKHA
jgi:ArsR family transcriptional regulator